MSEQTLYARLGGYDGIAALAVPEQECNDVVAFVLSLKDDIVEV
jgi:hypothetical protein